MSPSVPSSSIASSTLSRLWAGSPMPMNTTFFTGALLRASATWATISALPSWRSRPSRPVMQKVQPTAQPTWVDTHRPPRGSSTLSTAWPSASSSSSRVPSSPACSVRRRASACHSSASPGRALRSSSGKKSSGRLRPASSGSARVQLRSTSASCAGLAPTARRRWRRSAIFMGVGMLALSDVCNSGGRYESTSSNRSSSTSRARWSISSGDWLRPRPNCARPSSHRAMHGRQLRRDVERGGGSRRAARAAGGIARRRSVPSTTAGMPTR
jgi:hypothetical protein